MESPGQKYCSKCRFDYWSPGTPDYNGEMGMFLCLASETKCDDGLSMYATSRSMKIANGKDCYRYKMKRTFWWNPKPRSPYKVSMIGRGVVRIDDGK